ncbi:MAG: C10 family peptidase [Bacteroidales bacterium]|nr:C10 family peptidase [Bacteroidales bacterium]
MKRLAVILAILAITFTANAEHVSYKDAETVAKAYYYQTVNAFRTTAWTDISLSCVVNPNEAKPMYNLYIFDVNGDEGYIVVSTDDQIMPVLAYSFESAFNADNMSPGRAAFLDYYSESNDYAASNVCENAAESRKQWADLLSFNPSLRATRDVVTSPILLDGINWTQRWPFNSKCPTQPANDTHSTWGEHGHAYVGCVATATCMVMKYWNWPATGTGTCSHNSWWNGGHGNITINFANQSYNWYAMPDAPTSTAENEDLGKINYHVGVAVKMRWEYDGSGTQTEYVASALKTYFKYANDIQYITKDSYSDANWISTLKSQIDQKLPVVYSGLSTTVGHAWNCDGYQVNEGTTKFHMKWGWGTGDGSGFYTLDNLNSIATASGSENNFCYNQDAVINIHPNQTLSSCQNVTVNGIEGTFDDGSAASDYANNKECYYVINPSCGTYVSFKFPKFDLAAGDYVNVYHGGINSTELIGSYDADNLPPASGFNMLELPVTIKFVTDGANVADGWKVNYSVIYCSSTAIVLNEPSGSFGDGSKSCQYQASKTCRWDIAPTNATSITVSFSNFNVSSDGADYVAFYHDAVSSANRIVKFYSENLPTQPVTFPYGTILVKFYTNNNTEVGDGWLLNYTSSANSIDEVEIMSNLGVIPNPANDDARIAFTLTDASETTITITNMLGQVVGQQDFMLESGNHEISLKNFPNLSLQNQMYFVTLQNRNQVKTCKFLFVR